MKFSKLVLIQQRGESYKTTLSQNPMIPNWNTIFREVSVSFNEFINVALPVLLSSVLSQALLQYSGWLTQLTGALGPFISPYLNFPQKLLLQLF